MGYDIWCEVYAKQKNGKYEQIQFYDKDGKPCYNYLSYGTGELSALLTGEDGGWAPDTECLVGSLRGIPEYAQEKVEEEEPWYEQTGTYYDYVELAAYAKSGKYVELEKFKEKVDGLIECYNIYWPRPGEVMVVVKESY